jgi:hypothetical protein
VKSLLESHLNDSAKRTTLNRAKMEHGKEVGMEDHEEQGGRGFAFWVETRCRNWNVRDWEGKFT